MSDRFDDEIRRATARHAAEPLPEGVLDSRLDERVSSWGWQRKVATVAAGTALGLAVVVAFGQAMSSIGQPSPPAGSSRSATPSPAPDGSTTPAPSTVPAGACAEVAEPEPESDELVVYFTCEPPPVEPRAVLREAPDAMGPAEQLRLAMETLLAGPTAAERELGFTSVFGDEDEGDGLLRRVEWQEDGLAVIDFADGVRERGNLNTAHNSFLLFGVLEKTVFQFDAVTAIEYRLEGSCEAFATFFQTLCDHTVKMDAPLSVSGCPVLAPSELPSGRPTTRSRNNVQSPGQLVSWGSSADTVTQRVLMSARGFEMPPAEPVVVRGEPGFVHAVGDGPDSLVQMGWNEGECEYLVWIGPGVTLEEAIEYAARY